MIADANVYVLPPTLTVSPGFGTAAGAVSVALAAIPAPPPERFPTAKSPPAQFVVTAMLLPAVPPVMACRLTVVAFEPVAVTEALAVVPVPYVVSTP